MSKHLYPSKKRVIEALTAFGIDPAAAESFADIQSNREILGKCLDSSSKRIGDVRLLLDIFSGFLFRLACKKIKEEVQVEPIDRDLIHDLEDLTKAIVLMRDTEEFTPKLKHHGKLIRDWAKASLQNYKDQLKSSKSSKPHIPPISDIDLTRN